MKTEKEIVICWKCDGSGTMKIPGELYDPHKGLYHDPTYANCKKCGGLGRLLVITTTEVKRIDEI